MSFIKKALQNATLRNSSIINDFYYGVGAFTRFCRKHLRIFGRQYTYVHIASNAVSDTGMATTPALTIPACKVKTAPPIAAEAAEPSPIPKKSILMVAVKKLAFEVTVQE